MASKMNLTQLGDALALTSAAGILCTVDGNHNIWPCDDEVKLKTIAQVREYIAKRKATEQ